MRFILIAIAAMAFGATPSFSSPMPITKDLRAKGPVAQDAPLHSRNFVPIVARKKKNATASSTAAPASATPTGAADGATSATLVKIGGKVSEKIKINGVFGTANNVNGGFVFTKVLLPTNAVGLIEPEYNSSVANSITVVPKAATLPPPAGMLYVDPMTFVISTATPPVAGDTQKVDYLFTQATKAALDPTKVTIGKLDAATNQFVTSGVGEFEFEADEDEWSLKVADMNGEWGIFALESAVLPATAGED